MALPTKSDLKTMDYAYKAQPFVRNYGEAPPSYNPAIARRRLLLRF